MGASNFQSDNQYGTFIIEIEDEFFDSSEMAQDYRYFTSELKDEYGFEFTEGSDRDDVPSACRSYGSILLGDVCLPDGNRDWRRKDGESVCEVMVKAQLIMRFGYYAHANLDWDIQVESYHYDMGGAYDMGSEVEDHIDSDLTPKTNQELRWMVKFIERETERLEEILNEICTRMTSKHREVGTFSNGESVYEKV